LSHGFGGWKPLSVSAAVFEIMGPKHIGVTTLTFQGHVTSSNTWPFDSPYVCNFLLVVHWNRNSISNRCWNIQPPNSSAQTDIHTKVKQYIG